MKRILKLAVTLIVAALVIVSCSPESVQDGRTAETKKAMNSEEYKEYSSSIRGLTVAEAYVVVKADEAIATPLTRGLNGEYKYEFSKDVVFTTSEVRAELEKLLATCEDEKAIAFYSALLSSLPKENLSISLDSGSYINYSYDEATGIRTICSVDVEIKVNGKEFISIEKDRDDDWIEIEGVFFDNTQLEKMLDAAEDAAEAIEELFKNLKNIKIDLKTLLNGDEQKFSIDIKDEEILEARIEGTTVFKITDDKKLSTSFDFKYTEFEDDGNTIDEEFNLNASLLLNINPASIGDINLKLIENAKVTINGMEVWADAFLDELD